LNRPPATDLSKPIVISTETLNEMSRSGTLVNGVVQIGTFRSPDSGSGPSTADKSRWQTRVRKQRAVIAKLETRRARIEKAIDLINDGRLTPQALARIERAQIDLQFVDEEIRVAYLDLARIIREARQHGAEPGWFR
jgi:threonine dehydrogenase-like Zn-dependent dehydrogenase